jgi:hypothetical protein
VYSYRILTNIHLYQRDDRHNDIAAHPFAAAADGCDAYPNRSAAAGENYWL